MHHSILAEPEFWVLVSFVIFFALFGGKLWGALAGMLDARANAIRAELAEAHRLREEAETMLKEAEQARADAQAEAAELIRRSQAEAARLAQAAAEDAAANAKRRERMALDRIAAAEKTALNDVRQTAAGIASEAAQRVIAGGLGEDAANALLDSAIADLPRALRAA